MVESIAQTVVKERLSYSDVEKFLKDKKSRKNDSLPLRDFSDVLNGEIKADLSDLDVRFLKTQFDSRMHDGDGVNLKNFLFALEKPVSYTHLTLPTIYSV